MQTFSLSLGWPLRLVPRCPLRAVWHFVKPAKSERGECPWRSLSCCLSRNSLPFTDERRLQAKQSCWWSRTCLGRCGSLSAAMEPWGGKEVAKGRGRCWHRGVWTKRTSWGILRVNLELPVGWECCLMPNALFKALDNGIQAPKVYLKDSIQPWLPVPLQRLRSFDLSGQLLNDLYQMGIPVIGSETLVEPVNSGCLSLSWT